MWRYYGFVTGNQNLHFYLKHDGQCCDSFLLLICAFRAGMVNFQPVGRLTVNCLTEESKQCGETGETVINRAISGRVEFQEGDMFGVRMHPFHQDDS